MPIWESVMWVFLFPKKFFLYVSQQIRYNASKKIKCIYSALNQDCDSLMNVGFNIFEPYFLV